MEKATNFRNISSLEREGDCVLLLNRVVFATPRYFPARDFQVLINCDDCPLPEWVSLPSSGFYFEGWCDLVGVNHTKRTIELGVACWLARSDTQSEAARGLVVAMLLYDVAVLAFAGLGFGLHGVGLWPAAFLHAVMTFRCIACLRQKSPEYKNGH